jgi:hypothetical protein
LLLSLSNTIRCAAQAAADRFLSGEHMTFSTERIASCVLAVSALALLAASIAPAQAAKKTREQCLQLASQRGFNQVVTRAEADAKKAFIVSCMQGKQG